MTIKRRLAALEACTTSVLPLSARAWLGNELTAAERELAQSEAAQGFAANTNAMSKEAQAWLAV